MKLIEQGCAHARKSKTLWWRTMSGSVRSYLSVERTTFLNARDSAANVTAARLE